MDSRSILLRMDVGFYTGLHDDGSFYSPYMGSMSFQVSTKDRVAAAVPGRLSSCWNAPAASASP